MNSKLDSLTHKEAAEIIIWCINQPKHIEIGEISFWHKSPYVEVQKQKKRLLRK